MPDAFFVPAKGGALNTNSSAAESEEPIMPNPLVEPGQGAGEMSDGEKKAIKLATRAHPEATHFRSGGTFENSLGGTLVFVEFMNEDVPDDECVFLDSKGHATLLSAEQLARRIKMQFPSRFWRVIGSPASFSGFIALIITCTISYVVLSATEFKVNVVPTVLSSPLAVIVGFYFGRYALAGTASIREAAQKAVSESDPSAKNIRVAAVITQFLSGDLAIMNYQNSTTECWESYVYVMPDGAITYDDKRSLGELAHSYRPASPWQNLMSVTTFGGLIAMIICITLCALVIMQPGIDDPVPVLSSSLTTILAFYFGTQATKP